MIFPADGPAVLFPFARPICYYDCIIPPFCGEVDLHPAAGRRLCMHRLSLPMAVLYNKRYPYWKRELYPNKAWRFFGMSYSLRDFHFNPVKLGQIIKQLCAEKEIKPSYICKCTGITRDTFDNIVRGSVHDVKFEQLFKICCVLELPLAVIEALMVKDEDIDFEDQIVYYDAAHGEILPISDVDAAQIPVSDTVVAVAEAVAAADNPPDPVRTSAENPDNVAQLHKHIAKLMELLELSLTQKG
jgi:DNA-binding Xre family transcriptional regulator